MSPFVELLIILVCFVFIGVGICFIAFSKKLGKNAYNMGSPRKTLLTYFADKWGLSFFVWWYRILGSCFIVFAIFVLFQTVILEYV